MPENLPATGHPENTEPLADWELELLDIDSEPPVAMMLKSSP